MHQLWNDWLGGSARAVSSWIPLQSIASTSIYKFGVEEKLHQFAPDVPLHGREDDGVVCRAMEKDQRQEVGHGQGVPALSESRRCAVGINREAGGKNFAQAVDRNL